MLCTRRAQFKLWNLNFYYYYYYCYFIYLYGFCCFNLVSPFLIPEQILFRNYEITDLSEKLTNAVQQVIASDMMMNKHEVFRWTTVTGFKEIVNDNRTAWFILGGSMDRITVNSSDPYTKKAVAVVACQMSTSSLPKTDGLDSIDCYPLEAKNVSNQESDHTGEHHDGSTLLGMSVTSLEFESPFNGAVVVYCDPLWHTGGIHHGVQSVLDVKYQEQPGGRCRIRLRHNGEWSRLTASSHLEDTIEFCTNSGYSQPCGGGFSVDLQQINTDSVSQNQSNVPEDQYSSLPNIQLLTSLFLANPGEIQILDDILTRFRKESNQLSSENFVHRILGKRVQFSQQVKWTPSSSSQKYTYEIEVNNSISAINTWMHENLAIISSLSQLNDPSIKAFRPKSTESDDRLVYSVMNEETTETESKGDFTGFGFSMETVNIPKYSKANSIQRTDYGIIIGAPFDSSVKRFGVNHGRVYIACPEKHVTTKSSLFSIDGRRKNEFFGYSIARLGDVDGDGIDDVAIGAPAIQSNIVELYNENSNASLHNGRVYIYKVTPQCTLDPIPLQILESPEPEFGDGFGIGLSRGFDADGDGWPEFAVTSLKANTAPHLFTMPKLLKAQCQINIPPHYKILPFKKSTTLPFTIHIRLYDLHLRRYVNIPKGLSSTALRNHEIDPDVIWNQYFASYSNETNQAPSPDASLKHGLDTFTLSLLNSQFHSQTHRFELLNNEVTSINFDPTQTYMIVRFHLITLRGLEEMNLNSIPLKISYKSTLNLNECRLTKNADACHKHEQPIIDWSECEQPIQLAQPVCIPAPECRSDLSLVNLSWIPTHSLKTSQRFETMIYQGNSSFVKRIEYGNAKEQHQRIRVRIINLGPTKSSGLRVITRFYNWYIKADQEHQLANSIQGKITQINVKKLFINEIDSADIINVTDTEMWSVNIDESGTVALVSLLPHLWIYPNEVIQIDISVFIESLLPMATLSTNQLSSNNDNLSFMNSSFNYTFMPKYEIKVTSETNDYEEWNNAISIPYQIVYKPKVDIYAGVQPRSIIDDRMEPYVIEQNTISRKIFSYDIGPKLEHTYIVENRGWTTLTNVSLVLQLPYETIDGYKLLYLSDLIRVASHTDQTTTWKNILPKVISSDGREHGTCEVPKEYINPFGITLMDFKFTDERSRKSAHDPRVRIRKRFKRTADFHTKSQLSTEHTRTFLRETSTSLNPSSLRRAHKGRIILKCPYLMDSINKTKNFQTTEYTHLIKCIRIKCNLNQLQAGDTVRIKWTGWLWAETFFKLHKSDIQFISRLNIEQWGNLPGMIKLYQSIQENLHQNNEAKMNTTTNKFIDIKYPADNNNYFEIKQSIIFHSVQLKVTHKMPLWPIVVGITVGLLILMLLSALLYCCGFFTRHKQHYSKRRRKRKPQVKRSAFLGEGNNNNNNDNSNKSDQKCLLSDSLMAKDEQITIRLKTDDSRSDAEKKLSSTESVKQDNDNSRKGQIEGCEKYENADRKEDGESTRPLLNQQQSTTTKAEQQSRQSELAEGGELPDSSKHSNDSKQLL
uniref:Integrin alpha third immunoglobulin-like domain-containing protein n=1 Tax=Trichobilharzia regenti TaxID=157069 RepID=A0AA85JWT2_TRIRE|nr:unnamed protein product [Trichobilharzia regenti]